VNHNRRTNRMSALIQSEIARLLLQEVSDPALKELVVTEVDMSPDLSHAKVYFSRNEFSSTPLPKMKEVEKGFARATPFLRKKIGRNLELKSIPELRFIEDTHGQSVNRLFGIMESIK
jgi:ribosome-binding factor A